MLFLTYLLKASVCMTVFYALYFFVFRKFTFHTLNRFYLLVSLYLSFIIPFASFETIKVVKPEHVAILEPSPSVAAPTYNAAYALSYEAQPVVEINPVEKTIDWEFYLVAAYVCVASALVVFLCSKLFKIISLRKQATKVGSLWIVQNDKQNTNASFFNLIFLNTKDLSDNEKAQIIAHECVHVRKRHSIDVLLVELCKIVVWFNPIVYFYKKSLVEIHEFEADLKTIQQFDSKNYAHLLLKLGINHKVDLGNQFSLRPLSTRIQFLFKKRTLTIKKLFYFLGLPLVALGIFAFAQRNEKLIYEEKPKSVAKTNYIPPPDTTNKQSSIVEDAILKDTVIQQNKNSNILNLNNNLDSNTYKTLFPKYAVKAPEIKIYPLSLKQTHNFLTIKMYVENTPAYFSFDVYDNGKTITSDVNENDIRVLRGEKELLKGYDFDLVYEDGVINKIIFKEHIQSQTEGIIIEMKKITLAIAQSPPPNNSRFRYEFNINPQIPKTRDNLNTFPLPKEITLPQSSNNSKYRYRTNLNSQIPQTPDTLKVSPPKKD